MKLPKTGLMTMLGFVENASFLSHSPVTFFSLSTIGKRRKQEREREGREGEERERERTKRK